MPPHVPAKRTRSSPVDEPRCKRIVPNRPARNNVYSTEEILRNTMPKRTAAEVDAILNASALPSLSSSGSSSSDDDDDDIDEEDEEEDTFERVSLTNRTASSEEEEGVDWENALLEKPRLDAAKERASTSAGASGDLELTLSKPEALPSYRDQTGSKKGPSKMERQIRTDTHCLHLLALMWHNTIRNAWINDKQVQTILMGRLPQGVIKEIQRWRRACGALEAHDGNDEGQILPAHKSSSEAKARSKAGKNTGQGRDWSDSAQRQKAAGIPDMSAGDPLIRLLKHLAVYWKQWFRITAPGLRKRGYMSVMDTQKELHDWEQDGSTDQARFGECIANRDEFAKAARSMSGSRDVEAQLFTALLRGIGLTARLVASLQPAGFGWSQIEQARSRHKDSQSNGWAKNSQSIATTSMSDSDLSEALSLASDSEIASVFKGRPTKVQAPVIDADLHFPIYWTEALSPITNTYIPFSIGFAAKLATGPDSLAGFEPRGKAADKAKQVMCYVMAFSADGTAKDVTVRYVKKHVLPGKTKGFRLPAEKVVVHNSAGKAIKITQVDWFKRVQSFYLRPLAQRTAADDIEDHGDLVPVSMHKPATKGGMPDTLQAFKASSEFVLERHLRREEAVVPAAKVVQEFATGKGDKAKCEHVYRRKDVVTCKTVESWHKEGRQVRQGQVALKLVPIRAVTLVRKLEVESQIRTTGEKPLQGLYSKQQTEWIIPPPIQDGKIPKNAYGNIDIYVPSMIPRGAVHIPWGGTVKVCKKLGIDFAEAVTGFDFGHSMAVPVIKGVVVAEENENLVVEAWEEEEEKKRLREDEKRGKRLLGIWRKFALGLRIMDRLSSEYAAGLVPDEVNPFTKKKAPVRTLEQGGKKEPKNAEDDGDHGLQQTAALGGGFLSESMQVYEGRRSSRAMPDSELKIQGHEDANRSRVKAGHKAMPMSLRALRAEAESESEPESDAHADQHARQTSNDDQDVGHEVKISNESTDESLADGLDDSGDEEYAEFRPRKAKQEASQSGSHSRYFRKTRAQR